MTATRAMLHGMHWSSRLQGFRGRAMRRIVTFVLAALLSIAGTVGITATPALADAGACGWSGDVAGTVYYQNDLTSRGGPVFTDNVTGGPNYLFAQEQSYRYTSVPGDGLTPGHCY